MQVIDPRSSRISPLCQHLIKYLSSLFNICDLVYHSQVWVSQSNTLVSTALTTTGANSSWSPSLAVQLDVEASSPEDELRPTRNKAGNGWSATKGKGKSKNRDKNTGVIANGMEVLTNLMTKKGPPPPLNLKIDAKIDKLPSLFFLLSL